MNLTGWQAVVLVLIACVLALLGAHLGNAAGTGLVGLAGTIVGGVFALLQNYRSPQSRSRAGDRRDTYAGGNPITPPPETFPPPRR